MVLFFCFLCSCNKLEISQDELIKLRHVGNAESFEIDREDQVFSLKVYNLDISEDESINKSKGFAVELYKILFDRFDSFDTRTVFRILFLSDGDVQSFDYSFDHIVFLSGLTTNAKALFEWFGNGGEIDQDLFYKADCFNIKNQLFETNTGWRRNESNFLLLTAIEKTSIDICDEIVEGFILHYYHVELERNVMVYLTKEGKVVSLVSIVE